MLEITLQQISELPEIEQRRLKAVTNEYLGRQYAEQQRNKQIMESRTKMELEVELGKNENNQS